MSPEFIVIIAILVLLAVSDINYLLFIRSKSSAKRRIGAIIMVVLAIALVIFAAAILLTHPELVKFSVIIEIVVAIAIILAAAFYIFLKG